MCQLWCMEADHYQLGWPLSHMRQQTEMYQMQRETSSSILRWWGWDLQHMSRTGTEKSILRRWYIYGEWHLTIANQPNRHIDANKKFGLDHRAKSGATLDRAWVCFISDIGTFLKKLKNFASYESFFLILNMSMRNPHLVCESFVWMCKHS